MLFAVVLSQPCIRLFWLLFSVSPVLSKRPIVLFHGLDLRVLVGIFFLFYCRLYVGCLFKILSIHVNEFEINIACIVLLTMCTLPGYLPPLFLLMKHTMRRTKMRRAMAHISPINQPWVAMSTCRLGTAGHTERERTKKRCRQTE